MQCALDDERHVGRPCHVLHDLGSRRARREIGQDPRVLTQVERVLREVEGERVRRQRARDQLLQKGHSNN